MKKLIAGILVAGMLVSLGVGLTWASDTNPATSTSTSVSTPTIQQKTNTDTPTCPEYFHRGMKRLRDMEMGAKRLEERAGNLKDRLLSDLKERLGLTDDQISQIQSAIQSSQQTVQTLQDQLKTARQNLKEAMVANPTDTAKLSQAQETIASLEKQILENRVQTALKVKEIVGADKFAQLDGCFPLFLGPRPPGK